MSRLPALGRWAGRGGGKSTRCCAIGAALGQLETEATFAVLTGAGISVTAGIAALAAARKLEAVTVKLEVVRPTNVHHMVAGACAPGEGDGTAKAGAATDESR
eukprot:COSAG02_NODE_11570_length_1697_cov_99.140175_3_plen_103_part_00